MSSNIPHRQQQHKREMLLRRAVHNQFISRMRMRRMQAAMNNLLERQLAEQLAAVTIATTDNPVAVIARVTDV